MEYVELLKDTPVPTLLILAGIGFLLLAVAGQIAGKIEVPPARQKWAAIIGSVCLALGVALQLWSGGTSPTSASATPTPAPTPAAASSESHPAATPTPTVGSPAQAVQPSATVATENCKRLCM